MEQKRQMKYPFKFEYKKNFNFFGNKINLVEETNNIVDVFNFYSKKPDIKAHYLHNQNLIMDSLYDDRSDFKGGSFNDIFKEKKLDLFHKYEQEFFKKFDFKLNNFKTRGRVRSEYDGDFDYDKKYDISPFSTRGKVLTKKKSLKLYAELSFSGRVSSKVIDEYGAFVTALVFYFEKQGVNIELYLTQTGSNPGSGNLEFCNRAKTKIKNSGEYLAKSEMLKIFNTVYFRRIGFAHIVASCDFIGQAASHSLGSPYRFNKPYEYDGIKNELHIFSCPDFNKQMEIVDILKRELLVT